MATPIRVYFFDDVRVHWFDQDTDGYRTFHMATLDALWPDLPLLPSKFAGVPMVRRAWPVASSVLLINNELLVDVRRGVALTWVPYWGVPVGERVVSWDAGPILWAWADGNLHDVRTGVSRPMGPYPMAPWPVIDAPVIAIPSEPVRQIVSTDPPQVRVAGQVDPVSLDVAFPALTLSKVDEATLMFGDFGTPALADVTARVGDADLAEIVRLAAAVGVEPVAMLAALYLLSRLSPSSYHPDGHYGLAHMSAEQLTAGRWTDPPELVVRADVAAQLRVFGGYLESLAAAACDSAGKLLAALATGVAQPGAAPDTVVVAAPVPARLRRLLPTGADHIRLGDLDQAVAAVVAGGPGREFAARLGWGFVEPAGSLA